MLVSDVLRWWEQCRLHTQMALASAVLLALTIVIGTYVNMQHQETAAIEGIRQDTITLARNLAITSAGLILAEDLASLEDILMRSIGFAGIQAIKVADTGGLVVGHITRRDNTRPVLHYRREQLTLPTGTADWSNERVTLTADSIEVRYPIRTSSFLGWLDISHSLQTLKALRTTIWRENIVGALIAILADVSLLLLLLYRPGRALRQAMTFAQRLKAMQGESMPLEFGSRETRQLVGVLNEVSRQLCEQHVQMQANTEELEYRIRQQEATEQELRRHRDHLEELVSERTAVLSAANDELRAFAYLASHHLRAPLVNIMGFSEELREGLKKMSHSYALNAEQSSDDTGARFEPLANSDITEAMGFIEEAAMEIHHQINTVLELTRAGEREPQRTAIDLNALVRRQLDQLEPLMRENQIAIVVEPLPQLRTDRFSLEVILGHLLDNAVKYLDPSRPGEIRVSAEQIGSATLLAVEDNGIGIGEEDLDKIFALFCRSGRPNIPGKGVGLTFARSLVRRLGGDIRCESILGVGTCFRINLPNADPNRVRLSQTVTRRGASHD